MSAADELASLSNSVSACAWIAAILAQNFYSRTSHHLGIWAILAVAIVGGIVIASGVSAICSTIASWVSWKTTGFAKGDARPFWVAAAMSPTLTFLVGFFGLSWFG